MRSAAVILLSATLSLGCSSFLFHPWKDHIENPLVARFGPVDVWFTAADGALLHGWLFRAAADRGTILVLHGNAENLSTHVNSVLWLVPAGYNIFIVDYRGFGRSRGKVDLAGAHRDAAAAVETVLSLPGINTERIVLLGQSIGGAIAVYTLANSAPPQVKALVLDSPFSSYRRIAREKLADICCTSPLQFPLSFLFGDSLSPERWIGRLPKIPLLILHGEQDRIVPVHHGRLLYDAAKGPKDLWITAAPGHVRSFAEKKTRERFLEFLADLP